MLPACRNRVAPLCATLGVAPLFINNTRWFAALPFRDGLNVVVRQAVPCVQGTWNRGPKNASGLGLLTACMWSRSIDLQPLPLLKHRQSHVRVHVRCECHLDCCAAHSHHLTAGTGRTFMVKRISNFESDMMMR